MLSSSTAPDLLARFMREAILEARLIAARLERDEDRGPRTKETVDAFRVIDLIHNAPLQMFAETGHQVWPSGRLITGPEAALVEIVRLLPAAYGISAQDDLVLDWADEALARHGASLTALYAWAAPLIYGTRDYMNRPR